MLQASLFVVEHETVRPVPQRDNIGRVSLIAVAAAPDRVPSDLLAELRRTYRNPGMKIDNLHR